MKAVPNPDHIEVHCVTNCQCCHSSLEDISPVDYQKRQVFDIPPGRIEVTEHQAEIKQCPYCGECNKASFPEGVSQPVQYGNRLKAYVAYLNNYHFIPIERTCQLIEDQYGHRPTEAVVLQANTTMAENVQPSNDAVKDQFLF